MASDDFGIREGETAVDLPAPSDATLYFIGRIRTPWRTRAECPKNARESNEVCTIEVDPLWTPGLSGLETCSHVVVLARGEIWSSRCPGIMAPPGAPSRSAPLPGPTPLP